MTYLIKTKHSDKSYLNVWLIIKLRLRILANVKYFLLLMLICLLTLCAVGCRNNSESIEFFASDSITWKHFNFKYNLPSPKGLKIMGSRIILLGLADGKWVHMYDVKTGLLIGNYIYRGKKYNEISNGCILEISKFIDGFSVFDIDTREIVLFSHDIQQYNRFNVDSIVRANQAYAITDSLLLVDAPVCKNGIWLKRNAYILVDIKRKSIIDITDNPTDSENPEGRLIKELTFAPNMLKFATIANGGGTLCIYEISEDQLLKTFSNKYFSLEFIEKNGYQTINRDINYGFRSITSSDKYIFATFSDSKSSTPITNIGIWLWDGTPVKRIRTDKEIVKIAATPNENRLYGIIYTDDYGYQITYIDID